MRLPEPSLDPNRTVDYDRKPQPDTVDVSHDVSTGATGPYLPAPPAEAPTIPGYRITAEIAKGGMGRVYAGHDLTLDREVAVKTLLPGANAERFVTEAKITAKLPHPGIPPVYALGTLDDGPPWLAMKRIHGQTLADFLASRRHESSGRDDRPHCLQIFEQIAQAVGFAHSRGIIHRDLKPLNVMVGEFGEVQVMDWGLAKDTASREHDPAGLGREPGDEAVNDAHHTAVGTVMGTPGYMAPEQARGEVVDARADVFALGSILATILTGKPAFVGTTARETITRAATADLAEVLARLEACGADAELLLITHRCLAAQPEDRFADGRAVASAVAAYRATVEARLRQAETTAAAALVREEEQRKRRRLAVTAGIGIALVLLIGLAVSLRQMNRAIAAEGQAMANERNAETRRQEAERNLAFAKKGNELLSSVFTGLDPNVPYATIAEFRDALKANLSKAVQELEGSAIGEPLEVATLQNRLGLSLLGLGEFHQAIMLFQRVSATRQAQLGADHPDTLAGLNNLAAAYRDAGRLDQALPLFEETLKRRKAVLGIDHSETLGSMNNLAACYRAAGKLDQALALLEETRKLMEAKLGADHPDTLTGMNNLASGYQAAGQLDKAVRLHEEALKRRQASLGAEHPHTLISMINLGSLYQNARRFDKALPLAEQTLSRTQAGLGADHPLTLTGMNNLAEAYFAVGQLDKALPLYEQTLKLRKTKLGIDHAETLRSMNNLARCYQVAGHPDKALPLYEETLRLREAKFGIDHPDTLSSMNNLGMGYKAVGQLAKALPLLEETLTRRRAKLGTDHDDTLNTIGNLGKAYCEAEQGEKAVLLLQEFTIGKRKRFSVDDPRFAGLLTQVALDLLKCNQFAAAEKMLRESLTIRERKEPEAWTTFNTMSLLGIALLGQKKYSDAEPLLVKGYEGIKAHEEKIAAQGATLIPDTLDRLIELYTKWEKPDKMKKYLELRAQYPREVAPMRRASK